MTVRYSLSILPVLFLLPATQASFASPRVKVTEVERETAGHSDPTELRDVPMTSEGDDISMTQAIGISAAAEEMGSGCGVNPYLRPLSDECHPRNGSYRGIGELLKALSVRADVKLTSDEFERVRLTALLEVSRSGMSKITGLSLTTHDYPKKISWIKVVQHYSNAVDDPRTMQVYVEADSTMNLSLDGIRGAINFVDAYRRGRLKIVQHCSPSDSSPSPKSTPVSSPLGDFTTFPVVAANGGAR